MFVASIIFPPYFDIYLKVFGQQTSALDKSIYIQMNKAATPIINRHVYNELK